MKSESIEPFKTEIEYHRYWKEQYQQEKKRRQEAEGELSIIKTTSVTNSPEMREVQKTLKELEIRLAESLQINEAHHLLNGKLQSRLTEVEEDNKKLAKQIEDYLGQIRKAGII